MRRDCVVRTADCFGERAGGQAIGLGAYKQPKNLKSRRLAERRERRKGVWRRHIVSVVLRTNMADDSQCSVLHKTNSPLCCRRNHE
jgi:hypothetical protein